MGSLAVGTKIPGRVSRTLDVGDFSMLHQMNWFNMAIHSNSEYGKTTWFKERSLAGPLIFTVADGLLHNADNIAYMLADVGFEIYAYVGVNNMKLTAPVMFGDTLSAEGEVIDFRPTKNPKMNLFVYRNKAYNQNGQQVIEYETTMMVQKKD